MRIDKFLWCVRIFATRELSATACTQHKVKVNNSFAKPSRTLQIKDKLIVHKNGIDFVYKVVDFPKSRVGAPLVAQFIDNQTDPALIEQQKNTVAPAKILRPAGAGRPTKKDRRDWDDFFEE